MIDASIYLSYGVAGGIITTIISSLCYFNRRKMCKKEIVLQPEGIVLTTPAKLVLEVNNNDIEQWPIVN
jgi:hypothetical protein